MIPAEVVEAYGDMWRVWAGRVRARRESFRAPLRLVNRVSELGDGQVAFIIGAGLSSISGRFWDMWEEYSDVQDALAEDPHSVEGFVELLEHGGLATTPADGVDRIPELVGSGVVSLMLVFNYNCHIEILLSMCGVGYRSVSYNGPEHYEMVEVGEPKCLILKPHGSSRLSGIPTSMVWPDRCPQSDRGFMDRFLAEIEARGIRHVVILGYSCRHDEHMKPCLEELKWRGVRLLQVEKSARHPTSTLPVEWGVVKKSDLMQDLERGASDFLDALAEVRVPEGHICTFSGDPMAVLRGRFQRSRPNTSRLKMDAI